MVRNTFGVRFLTTAYPTDAVKAGPLRNPHHRRGNSVWRIWRRSFRFPGPTTSSCCGDVALLRPACFMRRRRCAARNPNASDRILVAGEFGEQTPLWNVPREKSVPRTAEALASELAPVFQNCREILFVDYRFDPREPRWIESLREFVRTAAENGRKFARCEYHFSLVGDRDTRFDLKNEQMRKLCRESLATVLSADFNRLELYQWRRIAPAGKRLHPRYVLTEIGGARIENGLDVGRPGEETDFSWLDANLWEQRWKEFQAESTPFKLHDKLTVGASWRPPPGRKGSPCLRGSAFTVKPALRCDGSHRV